MPDEMFTSRLFRFFGGFFPGFGGYKSGGHHHSDESQGNEQIMHLVFLPVRLLRACPQMNHLSSGKFVKSHKDGWGSDTRGIDLPQRWDSPKYCFQGETDKMGVAIMQTINEVCDRVRGGRIQLRLPGRERLLRLSARHFAARNAR